MNLERGSIRPADDAPEAPRFPVRDPYLETRPAGSVGRLQRAELILAELRKMPTVAAIIRELEYCFDHKDDPPVVRTPEEIQAALDRAYRPWFLRWFR